jgi:hypothetical protein
MATAAVTTPAERAKLPEALLPVVRGEDIELSVLAEPSALSVEEPVLE